MKSNLSAAFARGRLGAPRRFLRLQRHTVQCRNGHATALRAHPPTTHGLACGSRQLSLLPTALLCCSVSRSADRQPRDGFCEHRDTRNSAGTAMRRRFERTRPPHTAWPVALANSHSCQRTALLCCSVSRSLRNHFQLGSAPAVCKNRGAESQLEMDSRTRCSFLFPCSKGLFSRSTLAPKSRKWIWFHIQIRSGTISKKRRTALSGLVQVHARLELR